MIKKSGKQAIHIGGSLQILFGIREKRWDNGNIAKFYNEYWFKPDEGTRPEASEVLDNSCYW